MGGGAAASPIAPHPTFRLWLSTASTPSFPRSLLLRGLKLSTEAPHGVRASVLRLLAGVSEGVFAARAAAAPARYPKLLL